MGSCLPARGRKILRILLLKLFSRCFAFIVIFLCLKRYRVAGLSPPSSRGNCRCPFRGRKEKWRVERWIVRLSRA